MRLILALLVSGAASAAMHFDIVDARGKKPSGVAIEASAPDDDGWFQLTVVSKGKGKPILLWPFDGKAKPPDGPGEIPVILSEPGDAKALANNRVAAAIVAGQVLGAPGYAGFETGDLTKARARLIESEDPFAKGVALLASVRSAEAVDPLARALRERERQLTRVPSEIYPAAMLYGKALLESGKFDESAVAFLKALKQRPSDAAAKRLRAEALEKAGKTGAQ